MEKNDDGIIMRKGEAPEELTGRIEEKKGKIKRVLDEDGNVLKGWGYPQSVPSMVPDMKIKAAIDSGELVRGWGYPQSIPERE